MRDASSPHLPGYGMHVLIVSCRYLRCASEVGAQPGYRAAAALASPRTDGAAAYRIVDEVDAARTSFTSTTIREH